MTWLVLAVMSAFGVGDVHTPKVVSSETPCVLLLHGGGWTAMGRRDVVGIADYLCNERGMVVYNVDYRLASAKTPWPACGDDCVKAANDMFTEAFARASGVAPKKIWVMGGSAGGHLALWTGLSLPREKVAGIVSISGIADPKPDLAAHPSRYRALFGGKEPTDALVRSMDPQTLIRPNGPKILLTHAVEDKVVPIASAQNFAAAYRAAGNEIEFYDYHRDIEYGLTGHCIWRPNSSPHRLIDSLERSIADFMLPARVPEPQPLASKIEVHAFYYPGTECRWEWHQIERTHPHIKPLLGWYDETDPEVVDWQIKWAVEHGISAFCVDWYWNRGDMRLDHWVKAYYRAKHRRYLKWYMMYANHNQPGAHDEADTRRLVKFWIDNYFKTPEYYTIDGEPVVVLWEFRRFGEDFAAEAAQRGEKIDVAEGLRRAIALMQSIARDAGLKGIHFVSMYHASKYVPQLVDTPRRAGYAGLMGYNFDSLAWTLAPEARRSDDTKNSFDYALLRPAVNKWWRMTSLDPTFPFWPFIPTGWNDMPRSFELARVIRNRTPEKFRAILEDCRTFCEKNGFKRCIILPINEWQEGSYIEPNAEYGFAMYDAIRETFCEKPAGGWPKNITPRDVGLGPYDYPPMARPKETAWEFNDGVEGWGRNPYSTAYVRNRDGALCYFRNERAFPAVCKLVAPFDAAKHSHLRFRARITPDKFEATYSWFKTKYPNRKREGCFMWGTTEKPIVTANADVSKVVTTENRLALKTIADGQWHDYDIDLSTVPGWKGQVDELWFDPDNYIYSRIAIDRIAFEQ